MMMADAMDVARQLERLVLDGGWPGAAQEDAADAEARRLVRALAACPGEAAGCGLLMLACTPHFGGSPVAAAELLAVAAEEGVPSLAARWLDALVVARRLTTLSQLTMPALERLVELGPRRDVLELVERLALGYQHSPAVAARLAARLADGPAWRPLLERLAAQHWPAATALAPAGSEDAPLGDVRDVEERVRASSWLRCAASSLPAPATAFAFTYPYFPWPEGLWALDPEPGQGERPEITLYATGAGRTHETAAALRDSAGRLLAFSGCAVRLPGGARARIVGTLRDASGGAGAQGVPLQLDLHGSSLLGWTGRGSEVHNVVGVPRQVRDSGTTFLFDGTLSEKPRLTLAALRRDQRLQAPESRLPLNPGWAAQVWVLLSAQGGPDVLEIAMPPLKLVVQRRGAAQLSFRLEIDATTAAEPGMQGWHAPAPRDWTAPAGADSTWMHVSLCARPSAMSPGLSEAVLLVNGDPLGAPEILPGTLTAMGPLSLRGTAGFAFLKLWAAPLKPDQVQAQMRAGFGCGSGPAPLAAYPLHGPGVVALCDVAPGSKPRHLALKQGVTGGSGAQEDKAGPLASMVLEADAITPCCKPAPPTPGLFHEDRAAGVFIVGEAMAEDNGVRLQPGAVLWAIERVPSVQSIRIALKVSGLAPGAQLRAVLHGGSFWDALRTAHVPAIAARQVSVGARANADKGTLEIELHSGHPEPRKLLSIPRAHVQGATAPLSMQLEFGSATGLLDIVVAGEVVASVRLDLPALLGVADLDGVLCGVACSGAPVLLQEMQAQGHAGATACELDVNAAAGATESTTAAASSSSEAAAAAAAAAALAVTGEWECQVCTCRNPDTASACQACMHPRPASEAAPVAATTAPAAGGSAGGTSTTWVCPTCTFANPRGAPTCEMCTTPNPTKPAAPASAATAAVATPSSGPAASATGASTASGSAASSWTCGACTFLNEASASKCSVCNAQQPAAVAGASAPAATAATVTTSATAGSAEPDCDRTERDRAIGTRRSALRRCLELMMRSWPAEVAQAQDTSWDTTAGVLAIAPTPSEAPSDARAFALLLRGRYGLQEGAMDLVAHLDDEGRWTLMGSMVKDAIPGARPGAHAVVLRADAAGERLVGSWSCGESTTGPMAASLRSDATQVRGLGRTPSPGAVVTSLKEAMAKQMDEERIGRQGKDRLLRFSPASTGLANMEQGLTNVCYQNALLQALFMTVRLRQTILRPPEGTVTRAPLFAAVREAMQGMLLSQRPVLATKGLQEALQQDWRTGQQMDVADFHDYVMATLSEALPGGQLEELFGCTTAQVYQCTSCQSVKVREEQQLGLAIPLPRQFLPITDIDAVSCARPKDMLAMEVPAGFELLRHNLNKDKPEEPCVFLCIKRDPNAPPITELMVRTLPGAAAVPPAPAGYKSVPLNLNMPAPVASGQADPAKVQDQVHLFFERGERGSPITELRLLIGEEEINAPPEGFRVIPTNLNPSWAPRAAGAAGAAGGDPTPAELLGSAAAVSKSAVAQGPSTTPVKLCYRRGMPVTDVLLSESPPPGEAEYQVIDKPVNLALEGHNGGEVFLWVSESKCFPAPLTDLRLAPRGAPGLEDYEPCGPHVFAGDKVLLKRRGEGCPLTQAMVFRAPRATPPFRFRNIINAKTAPSVDAPAGLRDPLARLCAAPWAPALVDKKDKSAARKPSARAGEQAEGFFGAPSGDPVPSGLLTPRGRVLRLIGASARVGAVFVHGVVSGFNGLSGRGGLFGVLYRAEPNRWVLQGVVEVTTGSKAAWHYTSLEIVHRAGEPDLNGVVVDSSDGANAQAPGKVVPVRATRTSLHTGSNGPIIDICVVRDGEPIPEGFDRVQGIQAGAAEHANLSMGNAEAPATFLCAKRSAEAAPGDAVVEVALFIPEVEQLPDGFEQVLRTPSGADANLNLNKPGLPMYLCFKRLANEPSATRAVVNLALQWSDLGDRCPGGLEAVRSTLARTTDANLALGSSHTLFLCVERRVPSTVAFTHPAAGTFSGADGSGSLSLYAVSEERSAVLLSGTFPFISGLAAASPAAARDTVMGVLMPVSADQDEKALLPVPMHERASPRKAWLMVGSWLSGGDSSAQAAQAHAAATVWRFSEATLGAEIEAFWAWNKASGVVHFVQDSFLQLATASDQTEMWANGEQVFADRSPDSRVQTLVKHSFSSTVLDGSDMLVCDEEHKKTVHLQHAVLTRPPQHLVLTIKRMGFDFKNMRPVKQMDAAEFEPVLELPFADPALLERLQGAGGDAPDKIRSSDEGSATRAYGLYAVVVHTGTSANSGHYFSYARESSDANLHEADSPSAPWRLFNDSRIYAVSWADMVNQVHKSESNTGYLLFYRRLDRSRAFSNPAPTRLAHPRADEPDRAGPAKKARTSDAGQADEDIDEEEAELARAIALSQQDFAAPAPAPPTPPAASPRPPAPALPETSYAVKLLERLGRVESDLAPELRAVLSANETFLLGELEGRTSKQYLATLAAWAQDHSNNSAS